MSRELSQTPPEDVQLPENLQEQTDSAGELYTTSPGSVQFNTEDKSVFFPHVQFDWGEI